MVRVVDGSGQARHLVDGVYDVQDTSECFGLRLQTADAAEEREGVFTVDQRE